MKPLASGEPRARLPLSNSAWRGFGFLLFLFLFSSVAFAATLAGTVIYVVDGDTLDFAAPGQKTIRVRLSEIDAPETKQRYGKESRDHLRALCDAAPATVAATKIDRYGRSIGLVTCRNVDANRNQVRLGMAWVYDKYSTDKSLYADQDDARSAHRGLWADPQPVPPWVFRNGY